MNDIGNDLGNDFSKLNGIEATHFEGKKAKAHKSNALGVIKVLALVLTFVAVGEFFVYLFVLPMFRSPDIEFFGNEKLKTQDLLEAVLLPQYTNWLGYSTNTITTALTKIPAVESVSVHKTKPGKINITIKERKPVAITCIKENGRTVPAFIDKNGAVFKLPGVAPVGLPLISGLPMEFLDTRAKVPATYRSLLSGIQELLALNSACFEPISEICVKTKKFGNYELVLHPVAGNTDVFLDKNLNQQVWQYVLVTLDVIQELDEKPDFIDLRYGSVSLGKKYKS